MHEVREILDIVRRSVRKNTMPEIENMPGTTIGQAKYVLRPPLHLRPRGKQCHGIEISLYGMAVPDTAPAFIQGYAPIQPDHFSLGFRQGRQQGCTVRSEVDDGYVGIFLQT